MGKLKLSLLSLCPHPIRGEMADLHTALAGADPDAGLDYFSGLRDVCRIY